MSISSYEPFLGLPQYSDDDTSHGTGERAKWASVVQAMCPKNTFFVSPDFTSGNLTQVGDSTTRRHFDTIQGAIDEAEDTYGYGTSEPGVILVFPGEYAESITVTKNISIVGMCGYVSSSVNYGGMPSLIGEDSTSPTITFNPANSVDAGLNIANMDLTNCYDAADSTERATYLLDLDSPTAYPTYNMNVVLSNCFMRMSQLGTGNKWACAFNIGAGISLRIHDSQIMAEPQDSVAYMKNIFYLYGDSSNSKDACLHLKRVEMRHPFSGSITDPTFYADNGTFIRVYDCSIDRVNFTEIRDEGVAGTNTMRGLANAADATTHKNAIGVYATNT